MKDYKPAYICEHGKWEDGKFSCPYRDDCPKRKTGGKEIVCYKLEKVE